MDQTIHIPNHIIIEKIGEGGMGAVYLGMEDNVLRRQVAIKVMKSLREEDRKRFESEAIALAKLRHHNITMLYNYNLLPDYPPWYMIMEYVEGETLESILKRDGVLPVKKVLDIAVQTLDGLQHAHDKGIFHRDMKPANLMLSTDGTVKIMDFGIARIAGNSRLTRDGRVTGTLQYMSPEQVNGKEVGFASDIYSLGIVLYELLTGATPFENGNEFEIMQAQTGTKPPSPDKINGNIPKALNAAILKALEKNPSARFTNAGAFKHCLQQIAERLVENTTPKRKSQTPKPPTVKSPVVTPRSKQKITLKEEHKYLLGLGFLAVSLFVALLVLFYPSPTPTPIPKPAPKPPVVVKMDTTSRQGKVSNLVVEDKKNNTPDAIVTSTFLKEEEKKKEEMKKQEIKKQEQKWKQEEEKKKAPVVKPDANITTSPVLNVILNESYNYDSVTDNTKITLSVTNSYVRSGQVVVKSGAKANGIIRKNQQSQKLMLIITQVESATGGMLRAETTYSDVNLLQGKLFKVTLKVE
ncbi:MAG: serine/threonine protein kinase [Bacteroidales bacterium]|jgi:serine/threonine-protein kinase|nr:serine/threonine protein kinase [Bacteroidales bacterium]